ncbi:MAG: TIGR02646 family protein [Bacteroidetes bacterium]|nr:MAG: TIGR02646 family protein [Bacteroidota bacterium]
MRFITKQNPPHKLRTWFIGQPANDDGERINCKYDDMPSDIRTLVKQSLLQEQGYLCCYTGIRISEDRSHIEHLKPQSLCENNEDIAYDNMLAAYPGVHHPKAPFGAHKKGDWYDKTLLISPLTRNCEQRFRFTLFGKIKAADNSDLAASETITRLGLDHESLDDLRMQAIEEALYRSKKKPLSDKQLEGIIQGYCDQDTHSRELRPFCFVIQQAAEDLLKRQKRRREAKRHIRKSK